MQEDPQFSSGGWGLFPAKKVCYNGCRTARPARPGPSGRPTGRHLILRRSFP
ncbi:hypothetical protein HMPREF0262_03317 [Clostridium sp. ATCC 29733]|nr:hypothetical protein HMPREF0262_03317 [Clostridium sp. ATCC 29733]